MRASVRENWLTFNHDLEGRVPFMYQDVKGYVSAGVGNLIDATKAANSPPSEAERTASHAMAQQFRWQREDGAEASPEEVAAEWDRVKEKLEWASIGHTKFAPPFTTLHVTDEEMDRFVFAKLDQFEAHLKGQADFAGFDDWPADAQLGLLSMAWGMGPGFGFPNFRRLIRAGDFAGAAGECRFNPEIGTIVTRNDRDQQLFRNAADVVAHGLDAETLYWPGTPVADPELAPQN